MSLRHRDREDTGEQPRLQPRPSPLPPPPLPSPGGLPAPLPGSPSPKVPRLDGDEWNH